MSYCFPVTTARVYVFLERYPREKLIFGLVSEGKKCFDWYPMENISLGYYPKEKTSLGSIRMFGQYPNVWAVSERLGSIRKLG